MTRFSAFAVVLCLLQLANFPNSDASDVRRGFHETTEKAIDGQSDAVWDVVVYGGTSAGVIAAAQARRMGKSAIIVCPDTHLGGLSSGGLGWTDTGNKAVIGGLAREFYHRLWKHYQENESWRFEERASYGNKGQGTPAIDGDRRTMWIFEPHAAEGVFEDFVREYEIPVDRDEWLDRSGGGVEKRGTRIVSIRMLSGKTYRGRMFIDATYEGDLMAASGVSYHVGREATSVYGERWNGVQTGELHHSHWFKKPISPYVVPGDPSSGLLPRISSEPPGEKGSGDRKIQAYCYRMCLTDVPANRIPFPKPEGYDAKQYELLLRVLATGWREGFQKFDPIPNRKTDTNNHGPFSTDNIGFNYEYPEGSYEKRRGILREHETYQKGLMYFLANDSRVPDDVREKFARYGLAKDEFTDNGGWPHQIYVRESRRLVGEYVMTEHDCLHGRATPDPVGMGSYTMDSHNVQRYVTPEGFVQNEGDIGVGTGGPYQIAYGSLTPKKAQCENLLVPICVSSSHIAFGSIRMEPVFMILGHSAATAAVMSIDDGISVQDLPYAKLRARLLDDGQVLEYDDPRRLRSRDLPGVVVDDERAERSGRWVRSQSVTPYVGVGYQHDGNASQKASARFVAEVTPGRYDVRLAYQPHANRASNVPVRILHPGGTVDRVVNQRRPPPLPGGTVSLGTVEIESASEVVVIVSNEGADGFVIIDAIQILPVRETPAKQ